MGREKVIVDGDFSDVTDVAQALLDAEDVAIRLRDLARALVEEEEARRTERDLRCQLRRAKSKVKEAHNRVIMLASVERRRNRESEL